MGIKPNFNAKDITSQIRKMAKADFEKQLLAAIKKLEPTATGLKVTISNDMKKVNVTGVSEEVVKKAMTNLK